MNSILEYINANKFSILCSKIDKKFFGMLYIFMHSQSIGYPRNNNRYCMPYIQENFVFFSMFSYLKTHSNYSLIPHVTYLRMDEQG